MNKDKLRRLLSLLGTLSRVAIVINLLIATLFIALGRVRPDEVIVPIVLGMLVLLIGPSVNR